jgi:hypothetical protein
MCRDATGTRRSERHGRERVAFAPASSPGDPQPPDRRSRCLVEAGLELAFGASNLARVLAMLRGRQHTAQRGRHDPLLAASALPTDTPTATGCPTPGPGVAPAGPVPSVRSRTTAADLHDLGRTSSPEQT